MNESVLQHPLLLVLLGFSLAMTMVVVLLALSRASRNPSPGYAPPPVVYPSEDPGDRSGVGCLLLPLLIVGIVILLALLS